MILFRLVLMKGYNECLDLSPEIRPDSQPRATYQQKEKNSGLVSINFYSEYDGKC